MRKLLFIVLVIISTHIFGAVSWKDANIIYQKLVLKSGIKDAPQLVLIEDSTPNAFCTPKVILVTTAELLIDTKPGLAGVLGHELMHWKYGDSHHASVTYYELRSDREGLQLAIKAGYNKCAVLQWMRSMYYMYGDGGNFIYPTWTTRYNLLRGNCPKLRAK